MVIDISLKQCLWGCCAVCKQMEAVKVPAQQFTAFEGEGERAKSTDCLQTTGTGRFHSQEGQVAFSKIDLRFRMP